MAESKKNTKVQSTSSFRLPSFISDFSFFKPKSEQTTKSITNNKPKIYGKTRNQINFSPQNIQKLRNFSNANITNQAKRKEFMAVMDKLFSGNLQKRDMLSIFEGREITEMNTNFRTKVSEINAKLRSALRSKNGNFNTALQNLFTNYPNNDQISKSVLLLYAVLSTMNDIIRKKMENHAENGVNEETKKKIERELLYLAKKAIQLREKIFELSESA